LPTYKTLRIREEDYQRLKEVQKLLRQRGTNSIKWEELQSQDLVDVPKPDDDDESSDMTWGILIGLGAAALGYHLWKNAKEKDRGR